MCNIWQFTEIQTPFQKNFDHIVTSYAHQLVQIAQHTFQFDTILVSKSNACFIVNLNVELIQTCLNLSKLIQT